jgi:dihydroxyacetone kinase
MKEYLTITETIEMILLACRRIVESEPLLTRIDTIIGDCDHGLGMKRGFGNLISDLKEIKCDSINDLFQKIGLSLLKSMGGHRGFYLVPYLQEAYPKYKKQIS